MDCQGSARTGSRTRFGSRAARSFRPELSSCRTRKRDSGRQSWFAIRTAVPSRSPSSSNTNQSNTRRKEMKQVNRMLSVFTLMALAVAGSVTLAANKMDVHTSAMFQGPKANTGTVSHVNENGKSILRVSQDFKLPDTPAPTWRVVDTQGNIYTLDAFKIKGGEKREVVVPSYVKDIAKVQVYCAFAQVLLGEAGFSAPVK